MSNWVRPINEAAKGSALSKKIKSSVKAPGLFYSRSLSRDKGTSFS